VDHDSSLTLPFQGREASASRLSRRSRDGFILIAVLWILAALAGLVGMYSAYVSMTARSSAIFAEHLRTEEAIYAAVELTAFRLSAADSTLPIRGEFALQLGDAAVSVAYAPETARIDLNQASKETLVRLFASLGAKAEDARYYADRVIGWRAVGEAGQSAEAFAYVSAGLAYPPREGPFQSVEELWNVMALPGWLVEQALPFVTIFGDADAGLQPESSRPAGTAPPASNTAAARLAAGEPTPVRLGVRVTRAGLPAQAAEVVIVTRRDGDEPYDVLSWRAD
jgi:general secretion pathway protein K